MNLSKSGPSLSLGPRGLKHTIGPRGSRTTLSLPGTGLSYTFNGSTAKQPAAGSRRVSLAETQRLAQAEATAALEEERAFLRAVIAFRAGDAGLALQSLTNAPGIADALWLTGVIHLQSGAWGLAEQFLGSAIAASDDLGATFGQNGISAEITYPITETCMAHIWPNRQATRLLLAEACQEQADHAGAIRHMDDFIREDPSDPIAAISLADIVLDAPGPPGQMLNKAADGLRRTRVQGPVFWISSLMSGRVQTRLGNPSEAILDYMAGLQQRDLPQTGRLQLSYEMALCYAATGDRVRCRQELSAIYAADQQFADVAQRLGVR